MNFSTPAESNEASISFPRLTTLNLQGSNLAGLTSSSIRKLCQPGQSNQTNDTSAASYALQSLDLSATSADTVHSSNQTVGKVTIDLTGFTKLAAFAWHSPECPRGFYATSDAPPSELDVLCGKCPSGTEKLAIGGTFEDCKSCAERGLFDFDNDASTPCEASKFRVLQFEHYIPKGEDEGRYAFAKTLNDRLNNDPSRTPPQMLAEY